MFAAVCIAAGLPAPTAEYRFAPPRRWRFDWAYPEQKIALEVEGGIYSGGRHTRIVGFLGDIEKYNAAALDGWMLLRTTPEKLLQEGPELLRRALMRHRHAKTGLALCEHCAFGQDCAHCGRKSCA